MTRGRQAAKTAMCTIPVNIAHPRCVRTLSLQSAPADVAAAGPPGAVATAGLRRIALPDRARVCYSALRPHGITRI